MSYCRFSSDNFQCDLYVYMSGDDQITIHVANARPDMTGIPDNPYFRYFKGEIEAADVSALHKEWTDAFDKVEYHEIGGRWDGADIKCSIEEAVEYLKKMKEDGYKFPENVIDDLIEDMEDEQSENT